VALSALLSVSLHALRHFGQAIDTPDHSFHDESRR
jgi:hypothetical protein